MTSVMERHYYRSDIVAHESAPMHIKLSQILSNEDEDMLPILFRLYMSMESMIISDDAGVIYEETATDLEAKKLIRVPRSNTSMWSTLVTEVLNDMDVPEDEQDSILRKVVQAFPEDHHELPVVMVVDIYETRKPLINNIQSQLPEDAVLPITFKRYNLSVTGWFSEDDVVPTLRFPSPKVLAAQETITEVPLAELLSDRSASTVLMSEVLSRMDVPVAKRPVIVKEIITVLESAKTMLPICVVIYRVTHRIRSIRDRSDQMIQRVTNESMDGYEARPVPAAKSIIECLERVSLDDSEDAKESCVICMECFEDGVQAIRLPCSHIFHENCSVQWLMTSHLCPLCRYPMPSEEDLLAP